MTFLTRIAAARTPEQEGPSDLLLGTMGVAAASPFAGMIGQKPIIHDPLQGAVGEEFKDLKALQRKAQVGDVLLTSKPKGSVFKHFITPTGDSQFYHAQPVIGQFVGGGSTASAGDFHADVMEGRTKFQPRETEYITRYMNSPATGYDSAVLLRPKRKYTPAQKKQFQREALDRVGREYDNEKAVGSWFHDMFVPKWDFLSKHRKDVVCEGNVCSTLPAMAHHEVTGQRVVPYKASQDTFPTDFLRSQEYELVGSHVSPEVRRIESSLGRKIGPYAMRAGIGAGLAGGVYGASENPDMAGAVGGALGANALTNLAVAKGGIDFDKLPGLTDLFITNMGKDFDPATKRNLWKNFFTRRVPLVALGGAAGAGVVHAARNALNSRE